MMVIIDITAGNRHIWGGRIPQELLDREASGETIIFTDIEDGLKIRPDVVCDLKRLPFRDAVAHDVVADPPYWNFGTSRLHGDPKEAHGSWWGNFKNLTILRGILVGIVKSSRRVLRPEGRVFFKWCDVVHSWRRFSAMFKFNFDEVDREEWPSKSGRNSKPCRWITYRLRS